MRATNRITATVVALLLVAVSVVALVEIVLAALNKQPWVVSHPSIAKDLHARAWTDALVRAVCAATVVLGLLLLFVALKRSKPGGIQLDSGTDGVTMSVSRRSLQRDLAAVAAVQPGVDTTSTRAGRGRIAVKVGTSLRETGDLQQRVQQAVTERLDALRPAKALKTTVTLRRKDS